MHAASAAASSLSRQVAGAPSAFVRAVSQAFSRRIERAEVNAWLDLYAAAPAEFAASHTLAIHRQGDLVWTMCPQIPFIHFNCVKNLGVEAAATEGQVDELLDCYRVAGIARPWFYTNPHTEPAELPAWLEARGMHRQSGWERIVRDASPLPDAPFFPSGELSVECVTPATAAEWAGFIDRLYRLPTSPWLLALAGRPRWHHYLLRRGQAVLAVRSLFIGPDGAAWSGIDAPVPGVMAPSFDLDAMLGEAILRDGLAAGARVFVADIEAPRQDRDGPAYRNYARLGFRLAYFRSHYSYPPPPR